MSTPTHHTVKAYCKRIAEGDGSGFDAFYEAYRYKVYHLALKMLKSETEAEEMVQDVFLAVWQSRKRFIEITDPEAYLFTITYNTIYSRLKKIARNQHLLQSILHRLAQKQHSTEETIAAHEVERLIHDAIQQLPSQQRTILELSKQQGLSYQQIAEHLHLSPFTVRNHLAAAMKSIRIRLKKWTVYVIALLISLIA